MPRRPPDPVLTGRARGALFVLCGALFLDALDVSMKGMAVPAIGADLALSPADAPWVISAYTLGFGSLLLLGGRVADLYGRKRVFLASLVAFTAASTVAGLADSPTLLVTARFATGASAAFTAPAGLSIITTAFAEGPQRTRALSVYSATGASGFSLGLVVGGLLSQADWRLVFFLPAVLAAATFVVARRLVPDPQPVPQPDARHHPQLDARPASPGGLDLPGAATATLALLLLTFAAVRGPQAGWTAASTLVPFATAVMLGTGFAVAEQRSSRPLVRPGLLARGHLVRANLAAMALLGGWVATLFVITLYLQQLRGWSPLHTGLAVAPTGVVVALLAPRVATPLVTRFGVGRTVLAGLSCATLGYALLLPLTRSTDYLLGLLPAFLLVGLAFALAYGPLNVAATQGVDAGEQGVAAALVSASFQIGPTLALAAVAAVLHAHAGPDPGLRTATGTGDLLGGLRAALAVPLAISAAGIAVTAYGELRSPRRSPARGA